LIRTGQAPFGAGGPTHPVIPALSVNVQSVPLGWHFFGLAGALWEIVLSYFSILPTTIAFVVRHGLFDARKELGLLPALLAGVALGYVL